MPYAGPVIDTGAVAPAASAPDAGQAGRPDAPQEGAERRTRRMMFASQKGGVGKTASAVNVAASLGLAGHRVLLVDTDPIGSVSACFGVTAAPGHPGLFGIDRWELDDLLIPEVSGGLDLLPYAEDRRPIDLNALHRSLAQLARLTHNQYDFVIVDTRPSVADMTRRLCQVVDEVVVCFQCHPLAYRTLGGILGQLRDARADGANARLVGLLLTMVNLEDPNQVRLEAHIRQSLGQALLPLSIPQDNAVKDGVMEDRPAVLSRPQSPAARAYRQLSDYLAAARARE